MEGIKRLFTLEDYPLNALNKSPRKRYDVSLILNLQTLKK